MVFKGVLAIICAALFVSSVFADEEYTTEQIKEKITTYTKMETAGKTLKGVGWGLIGVGIACVPIGVGVAVNADDASGEMAGVMVGGIGGGLGIGFGMVGTIAGGVLKGIGRDKKMEYESRLSLRITGNGVTFVVGF
jgi:hypothetical protein